MMAQFATMGMSWRALLALPLLAFAAMAQAGDPVVNSNRKADIGAPVAASKSARNESGPSAHKRATQAMRSEQSPAGSVPRKVTNAPVAATGATAKQDQGQDVPCFKTRLCE